MHKFYYLKAGLSVILVFVGIKMILIDIYKIPIGISLGFIMLVIFISIYASFQKIKKETAADGTQKKTGKNT